MMANDIKNLSPEQKRALLADMLRKKAAASSTTATLTAAQAALWFLYTSEPTNAAYNVAFSLRIQSAVDPKLLTATLQRLVTRHAALRTTIGFVESTPVQVVHGFLECGFTHHANAPAHEDALRKMVEDAYAIPFDLEKGPLFRAHLFSCDDTNHVLLLTAHHCICDAWSLWLIAEEFSVLYQSLATHTTLQPVPEPPLYTDFAKRQLQFVDSERYTHMQQYWKQTLCGELPVLELPVSRPYPKNPSHHGACVRFVIDTTQTQQLRALAQKESTTLYVVLVTAYAALLHRYSGQEEILIGTPVAGRTSSEFERTVGYFVNQVALRVRVDATLPVKSILDTTRKVVLEALDNQEFPFAHLVKMLQPKRGTGRSPVFQAYFVLQRPNDHSLAARLVSNGKEPAVLQWGNLSVTPFPIDQMLGQFEIALEVEDRGTELHGCLKYRTELFDAATISRMAGHYTTVLANMVCDPQRSVATCPMLPPHEQELVLTTFNATDKPYQQSHLLHQFLEQQAATTPHAIALVYDGATVTYDQLNRRANRIAHFLRSCGVGPEVVVGVCAYRSVEMVVALYAILKAGGAYLPIDPGLPPKRARFMLADAGVQILLTHHVCSDAAGKIVESELGNCTIVDIDARTFSEFDDQNPATFAKPDNLAYVIYTSGSTGAPKGAMNTHRGICNRLLWMQETFRLTTDDCVLQKTPYSFDVSVWEFFWPLMIGARLVIARAGGHVDNTYLVDCINNERVTTIHFVPSMLRAFLETAHTASCPSLRRVICSGEELSKELCERFFSIMKCELHNLYGPTEAAVDVSHWQCRPNEQLPFIPIGTPIANTKLYVLDTYGNPQPCMVPGELHIGGVQVGRGYINNPELTASRFIRDPFATNDNARLYKTGDRARFHPDGVIEYLGRMDFQVKIRGFRIELGEIEQILQSYTGVHSCVVVARADTPGNKRIVAYVVADSHTITDTCVPFSIDDLKMYAAQKLPDYMLPAAYVLLDNLPLNANGKVDRAALPRPRSDRPVESLLPLTAIERDIQTIWKETLGVETVGINENFFDAGGDSITLGIVHQKLRTRLDARLELIELFHHTTIAAQAARIAKSNSNDTAPGVNAQQPVMTNRNLAQTQRRAARTAARMTTETTGDTQQGGVQ